MGFYLRDSIRLGPLRFNLSKGGLGVSIGVKGLRVGTGPKGAYLHAGRDGLYYRRSLGSTTPPEPGSAEAMIPVPMASASALAQSGSTDLVAALNAGRSRTRIRGLLTCMALGLAVAALIKLGSTASVFLILAPLAWMLGGILDRRRRTTRWGYAEDVTATYQALRDTFEPLSRCQGRWRILAGRPVQGRVHWKRHAGAAHVISRKPISLRLQLPALLDSDLVPPAILVPGVALYLLPDMLLVEDGSGFASIGYAALTVRWATSNFVEEGPVPSDAEMIDHVWAHPNRDGGPDQRFRNNRPLPRCRYGELRLSTNAGFDLLLQFSDPSVVAAFARALAAMKGPASTSIWDKAISAAVEAARALPNRDPPAE